MPRTKQPASGCTTRLHKKRPTPTLTLEGTGIKPTQRVQLNSTQQCECTQMVNFSGRTKKRPQHDFGDTVHNREHHLRRASACGRPTVRDGHSKKKKSLPASAPTATLSETTNHTSIPHQNKLKDQRYTTVFPLPAPFHSQSSRCCFPITQTRKT